MDSESLAQIQQIVTAATETIEARLGDRIAEVREHSGVVEARITEVRRELGDQISGVQQRAEILDNKISAVQQHTEILDTKISAVQQHTEILDTKISAVQQHTEILDTKISAVQRHTGVLIEDLHHKFELVIEGQQVLHREIANVRTEMQQESQETRALLRLSYQQLQQRVENLE